MADVGRPPKGSQRVARAPEDSRTGDLAQVEGDPAPLRVGSLIGLLARASRRIDRRWSVRDPSGGYIERRLGQAGASSILKCSSVLSYRDFRV